MKQPNKVTNRELANLHCRMVAQLEDADMPPHWKMLIAAQVLTWACLNAGVDEKDAMLRAFDVTIDVLYEEAAKAYNQLN